MRFANPAEATGGDVALRLAAIRISPNAQVK